MNSDGKKLGSLFFPRGQTRRMAQREQLVCVLARQAIASKDEAGKQYEALLGSF